jgi:hypothetical protein
MSRTVYLVRLRTTHRIYEDIPARRVIRAPQEAEGIFLRRTDAEAFTRTQVPIGINPFGRGYGLYLHNRVFSRRYSTPRYPDENDSNRVLVSTYCEQIRDAGLPSPKDAQAYAISDWSGWWKQTTDTLSVIEKQELKTKLTIAAVHGDPFGWCSIAPGTEQGDHWIEFTPLHEFLLSELRERMGRFAPPRKKTSPTKS